MPSIAQCQQGFSRSSDFDTSTVERIPARSVRSSERSISRTHATRQAIRFRTPTSPPNPGGQNLQQRSNFLLTAGFTLPGFDGVLRAFRTFKPVVDSTKPTGWKFVNDGTKLWPDLDGRPAMAGKAQDARPIRTRATSTRSFRTAAAADPSSRSPWPMRRRFATSWARTRRRQP